MARVLIVGGGLGGSLLAVILARRGHSVDVFERRATASATLETKRSALNITLCERGLHALERVGLRDRALELAVPARGRRVHVEGGGTLYQPYGNRGEAIYSVRRSDLNELLVEFARSEPGVRFHEAYKLVRVDSSGPVAYFEPGDGGATVEMAADVLIGADGAYSTVRAQLQKLEHFNYSQQYWRGGGYKSLYVPPREAEAAGLVEEALHIWPRGERMMMGFPNRDGSVMLSLLLPLAGGDSYETLTSDARVRAFFEAYFPDVVGAVPDLSGQFLAKPVNPLLTIRCDPWSHAGKVLLLGDAAHAMLPSYGQGANAAFEDCACLDDCLVEHAGDWCAALAEFERRRRPSLDLMAGLCVEHFSELCERVSDPVFQKRREVERRLEELYPDLYRSLYSMVSFTCMSYAEAHRIEQSQRRAVDEILATIGDGGDLRGPEVLEILQNLDASRPRTVEPAGAEETSADRIFRLGMSFWEAKVVLSAVELGVFSELERGPRSLSALCALLELNERGARDFLDALVALGLLSRAGDRYSNTPAAAKFLSRTSASYIGGAMELANARLYPVWGKLTEALRTGLPQNEAQREEDYYGNLARDPERLKQFLRGMTGLSMMSAKAIARKFPWREFRTFADIGGAQGVLAVQLAAAHDHLSGVSADLAPVRPAFDAYVASTGVGQRVKFQSLDFFVDPLPSADVLIMGHVLHNWDLPRKQMLIQKAFDALSPGGCLIVYEALIDDERRTNVFGLLMSLNMLLVTSGGFVFSGADCESWMRAAGFRSTRVEHLQGPDSMVVGVK